MTFLWTDVKSLNGRSRRILCALNELSRITLNAPPTVTILKLKIFDFWQTSILDVEKMGHRKRMLLSLTSGDKELMRGRFGRVEDHDKDAEDKSEKEADKNNGTAKRHKKVKAIQVLGQIIKSNLLLLLLLLTLLAYLYRSCCCYCKILRCFTVYLD